jgi:hypothetical protein
LNENKVSKVQIVVGLSLFGLLVVGLVYIEFFYSILIINEKGLTALIEAETTLLGFFGLIIAYLLTSLDTKSDKLDEVRAKENPTSNQHRNDLNPYKGLKKKVIKYSIAIGAMLTLSLFLSVGLLGVVTTNASTIQEPLTLQLRIAGTLMITFIAVSVFLLFTIFYNIGNKE